MVTTLESQLAVLGPAVTGGTAPKATLFEPGLFRKFVATSLLTESYDGGVASGLTENRIGFELRHKP